MAASTTLFKLIARTALTYRGRELRPGDPFEATAPEAAAYTHNRQADFADAAKGKRKAKPRRYLRRDLQAQDS